MNIQSIFSLVTPESAKEELDSIHKFKIPIDVTEWILKYEKFGHRDKFIWQFWYKMFCSDFFPVALKGAEAYQDSLSRIKLLITMFVVLIDDPADQGGGGGEFLDELLQIPSGGFCKEKSKLSKDEREYIGFTLELWEAIRCELEKLPNSKELDEVFQFDINQIINTIRYSSLINKDSRLINVHEYWLYLPANMAFMIGLTINLMAASRKNLMIQGELRYIISEAQKMGRIGNWITTWRREIVCGDFSSAVVAYAIQRGIMKGKEIVNLPAKKIEDLIINSNIESDLLSEWEHCYNNIMKMKGDADKTIIDSVLGAEAPAVFRFSFKGI